MPDRISPTFVADAHAPRLLGGGPFTAPRRAPLVAVSRADDVVVLRYALSDRCQTVLEEADAW